MLQIILNAIDNNGMNPAEECEEGLLVWYDGFHILFREEDSNSFSMWFNMNVEEDIEIFKKNAKEQGLQTRCIEKRYIQIGKTYSLSNFSDNCIPKYLALFIGRVKNLLDDGSRLWFPSTWEGIYE